jgi:phosphoribosylformylglycinamidine synthase
MPAAFELPIAHGEGKFLTINPKTLATLKKNKQIVFTYAPQNPNGSQAAIAGLCNKMGNVVGLMPHPERGAYFDQRPDWTVLRERFEKEGQKTPEFAPGIDIFKNAVKYFS